MSAAVAVAPAEAPVGGRLPLAPLLAAVDGSSGLLALRVGVDRRTVTRWRHEGLDALRADRCAVALGQHPAEVWGRAWWSVDDA